MYSDITSSYDHMQAITCCASYGPLIVTAAADTSMVALTMNGTTRSSWDMPSAPERMVFSSSHQSEEQYLCIWNKGSAFVCLVRDLEAGKASEGCKSIPLDPAGGSVCGCFWYASPVMYLIVQTIQTMVPRDLCHHRATLQAGPWRTFRGLLILPGPSDSIAWRCNR